MPITASPPKALSTDANNIEVSTVPVVPAAWVVPATWVVPDVPVFVFPLGLVYIGSTFFFAVHTSSLQVTHLSEVHELHPIGHVT